MNDLKYSYLYLRMSLNGADFSVFINTATEFDGSDKGASPDEAVSWGKITREAKPVKIFSEATLVFPLLVAVKKAFACKEILVKNDTVA